MDEICGDVPPDEITDSSGTRWTTGDCWCTKEPGHEGGHACGPCTERHGAPSWTDKETDVWPGATDGTS